MQSSKFHGSFPRQETSQENSREVSMNRSCRSVAFVVLVVGSTNLWAQNTQRGAVMGGLGGAIAGAIIGENNDKPAEGAAIGAAIGALGGAVMGNARDKEINQRRQYYQYQPHYQSQYHQPQVVVPRGAVSSSDVISMSRSGLNDSVIINQIQTRGVQRRPEVSEIITMHQQGVSDTVITAMQQAHVGGPAPTYVAPQPPTVIVEERYPTYYAPPPPVYYHRSHHHHHW